MGFTEILWLLGGLALGWVVVSKLVGGGSDRPTSSAHEHLREMEAQSASRTSRFEPVVVDGVKASGEVVRLVKARKKLQAIKQLRSETGVDLSTAKGVVDRIEAGRASEASPQLAEGLGAATVVRGVPVSPEVLQLVAEGKAIQAIKALRDQTGLGLREAKAIVDEVAEGHH